MAVFDDSIFENEVYSEVCLACKHFHRDSDTIDRHTCDAFPDGIPWPIWNGEHKHRTPYEGDRGIQYEAREGSGRQA